MRTRFRQLTGDISSILFVGVTPNRVEPGEQFDLIVQTQCENPDGCGGQPIQFFIDGEPWIQTTGADIDPADDGTAFDGLVDVVFEEPGSYTIRAEVNGNTATHELGVGQPPAESGGSPTTQSGVGRKALAAVGVLGALAIGSGFIGDQR